MKINKNILIKIVLILILLLGAFFRLYRIRDYMTFLGDEGRDVLVVKQIIVDHKFTLLGPTASVGGFFLGPIYYYFMLPFLWLFRMDPVGPAVMVALFGIATIFLLYKTGKDFISVKAGLFAALIYAISPVIVAYSRASWNPNLVPFFSLLIIYLARKIIIEDKWKWLFWLGVLFGIAFQLHYLVTFLAVALAVYLFYYGRLLKIKYYGLAILGWFIGILPFFLFEVRHGFPNSISLFNFIFHGKEVGIGKTDFISIISDVVFRLFDHLLTNKLAQNSFTFFNSISVGKSPFYSLILLLFSFIVFFFVWYRARKILHKQKTYFLIFLWGFIGIFLFGFYTKGIYDYYFGFMFPLPFLLMGLCLSFISQKTLGKIIAIIILAFIFWVNWEGRPFKYPPNRQLNQTITISRFIFDKTEGKPFNFALITNQNSDHAYRYFFEIWRNKPVVINNQQIDPQRKSVTSQLLVICEKIDCQPLGNSLWEVAGFGRAEVVGEWNVSVVKVFKLIHYKVKN